MSSKSRRIAYGVLLFLCVGSILASIQAVREQDRANKTKQRLRQSQEICLILDAASVAEVPTDASNGLVAENLMPGTEWEVDCVRAAREQTGRMYWNDKGALLSVSQVGSSKRNPPVKKGHTISLTLVQAKQRGLEWLNQLVPETGNDPEFVGQDHDEKMKQWVLKWRCPAGIFTVQIDENTGELALLKRAIAAGSRKPQK